MIDRVSPVLVDKTLDVTCSNARVLDVRCERYVAPWREGAPALATSLRDQRTSIETALAAARVRAQVARAESEALAQLLEAAVGDLAAAAARGQGAPSAASELAELDKRDAAARARRVDAEIEAEELSHVLDRVSARLRAAESEAGEHAARLVIDLIAETTGDAMLCVSYIVPGAAWRPYHRAHARARRRQARPGRPPHACGKRPARTGPMSSCTARSSGRRSVSSRPCSPTTSCARAGAPRASSSRRASRSSRPPVLGALEVPGIDDGGLGLRLSAGRVSVRADGTPHRVPRRLVRDHRAGHRSSRSRCARAPSTCARGSSTPAPRRCSPVRSTSIMTSGYVGRGEIGFVAPNEKCLPRLRARLRAARPSHRDARARRRRPPRLVERADRARRGPALEPRHAEARGHGHRAHPDLRGRAGRESRPRPPMPTCSTSPTRDHAGHRARVRRAAASSRGASSSPPLGRRAVTLEYKIKCTARRRRRVASMVAEMFANRVSKNATPPRQVGQARERRRAGASTTATSPRYRSRSTPTRARSSSTTTASTASDDAWLDELAAAAREAMRSMRARCFVKQRERLTHRRRRSVRAARRAAARGAPCTRAATAFRVNLSDYIDTGLFLDHRITRAARRRRARRQTMLNLFCYTGAFSVYGAAAGMATDERRPLEDVPRLGAREPRAQQARRRVVHSDVREFLADARRAGRRWDLAVVDPPTFSNSKRMDYIWDVQRDHAALLDDVARGDQSR